MDEGAARTILEAAAKQSGVDKRLETIVKDSFTKEQMNNMGKMAPIYALLIQRKVEYKWSW